MSVELIEIEDDVSSGCFKASEIQSINIFETTDPEEYWTICFQMQADGDEHFNFNYATKAKAYGVYRRLVDEWKSKALFE